jgi:PncC family amidohydrolase
MANDSLARDVARLLADRGERLVLAESCTAGLLAATLGRVPGISNHLCGSAVTYRADLKRHWLGVKEKTIKRFTTESRQVAAEMALGVLCRTPEADWAVAVVGHMGPDSPKDKDGEVFACFARRTKKGNLKVKAALVHRCQSNERSQRQEETVGVVLAEFIRLLGRYAGRGGRQDDAGPSGGDLLPRVPSAFRVNPLTTARSSAAAIATP